MEQKQLKKICNDLYELCLKAKKEGELPIAAILVGENNKQYGCTNYVESSLNPLEHSEIRLINKVIKERKIKYLNDMTLICSLEPCLMCLGAILKVGIKSIFYITSDEKEGSLSFYNTYINKDINIQKIDDERFDRLLKDSFLDIREKKK